MVSEEQLLKAKGFSSHLIATLLKSRKVETRNIYIKEYGSALITGAQKINSTYRAQWQS